MWRAATIVLLSLLAAVLVACGDPAVDSDGDPVDDDGTDAVEDSTAAAPSSPPSTEDGPGGSPGGDSTEEVGAMEGDWVLVDAEGPGTAGLPPASRDIVLTVEPERLSGSGGCNSYGAEYSLEGASLSIGDVVRTEMACDPQEVMDAEAAYFDALAQVDQLTVSGDHLVLSGGEVTLRFSGLMIPATPDEGSAGAAGMPDG